MNHPAMTSSAPPLLPPLLLRQRVLLVGALALVVGVSWAWLVGMSSRMGGGAAAMAECAAMPGMGSPEAARPLSSFPMWAVMALAMMLPTALPLVLLFGRLWRSRHPSRGLATPTLELALGYLAVWLVFGAAAAVLQSRLQGAGLATPLGQLHGAALGGATLIGVGLFQLTPLKKVCLTRCRSPLLFLMTRWRSGRLGPFAMGLDHGLFCLGCCWALMLVMFVAGVMNLLWMAALTVLMILEKMMRRGELLARGAGVAALGGGVWLLLG